ncbi:MAG: hypothetical protein MUE81_12305 [Thermoflexibacter sp.]|jgi:hypothetical protein|nr:hypothetical protein [Thermoflexibacter sp.]
MKTLNINILYLTFFTLVILSSCEKKDFEYKFPEPQVFFTDGRNSRQGVSGGVARVQLTAQSAVGLQSVKITQSINNAPSTPATEITNFTDPLSSNITYEYPVPATTKQGDVIKLTFEVTDKQGTVSKRQDFTINVVGALFLERRITIGGREVISLEPPAGSPNTIINIDEYTLRAGQAYMIRGTFTVEEGLTLILQAGTEIYANTENPQIVTTFRIPAGAFIRAQGTKDRPILMTSDKVLRGTAPAAGDWQGLDIYGKARENANDNSGTLSYIRLEYGGRDPQDLSTTGSIRFNSVGAGTTIQYLQSFKSFGQGIRFNGGTTRAKYLLTTDAVDGGYRLDDDGFVGYTGFGQFWVAMTTLNRDGGELESRDGSNPTITNMTLLGPGNVAGIGSADGVRIRNTTTGYRIANSIIASMPDFAFRAENGTASTDLSGNRFFAHSATFNIRGTVFRDNATVFSQAVFNNSTDIIAGIGAGNPVPTAEPTVSFNPSSFNAWFTNAGFRGAIRNAAGDWTADGTWCKNSDGTIR